MLRPWVDAARRGDHAAFEQLVASVLDRCFVTAVQILRDAAAAEDAVQEAMIRAWRDLPTLREPDRFEAWLRRILVRACYDEARRSRRRRDAELAMHRSASSVGRMASDPGEELVDRDAVQRVLARLKPVHRAALVLRHVEDLSVREVAQALGVPLGTAKSRLHHAEQELRAVLDESEETK